MASMDSKIEILADREARTMRVHVQGTFTYVDGMKIYMLLTNALKAIQGKNCPEKQSD